MWIRRCVYFYLSPFKDKVDMMVNINSTLQMPSKTPVLTVLDPDNCAESTARILRIGG